MGVSVKIDGLPELRAMLMKLPPELVQEAGVIVQAQCEAALREIAAAYPVHTGALRAGLSLEFVTGPVSVFGRVKNTARHAYIFETGGKGAERHWKRGKSTGIMPAGKVFIPIAMQRRRIMLAALIDLVERSGLHVSGAAA